MYSNHYSLHLTPQRRKLCHQQSLLHPSSTLGLLPASTLDSSSFTFLDVLVFADPSDQNVVLSTMLLGQAQKYIESEVYSISGSEKSIHWSQPDDLSGIIRAGGGRDSCIHGS